MSDRRWGSTLRNPQRARLTAELEDLAIRLGQLEAAGGDATVVDVATKYLTKAQDAHQQGEVDDGWHFAYRVLESLAPTSDDLRLISEANDLRAEVEAPGRFTPWRAAAIRDHLDVALDVKQRDERRRAEFAAALRLRHLEYENLYRRLSILRRHQAILLLIGLPALAVAVVLIVVEPTWSWEVLAAVSMGVVGAVVSAAERSTKLPGGRIPTQLNSVVGSLSRIPIGAVAGLTVWLAAEATRDSTSPNAYSVLVAAFGAGFSERLVTPKAVDAPVGHP